ncbi:iron complex transport system permease protein [Antricoccus suffuscus]|uniref:Iron complex transport system permease protein n=1 Tax=Antricoccus suffuscus TaxID=1629062 RepID=A0A2T0ZYU0_9ACTN|nr:iron chelate uptake ABC transporter family permease subunit [Antricoccus suffuscus]PRZ41516.1 iron complex transport system permease protein [Antricoccus suffuscus]
MTPNAASPRARFAALVSTPATSATADQRRPAGVAGTNSRRLIGLLIALAALALVSLVSIAVGSKAIPLGTVWDAIFGSSSGDASVIIWDLRVPRTLVGIAVGASLGVSGALIQAMTRNPLADPGILGVNAGAAFFVVIGIGALGVGSVGGYMWLAFVGALVVTVAVYIIGSAGRGAASPVRLTLAGVALGAVLTGITSGLVLLDPQAFDKMRTWNAGSITGRSLETIAPVLPLIAIGLLLAFSVARPLNAVALGDDLAASLGTSVFRTRVIVIVAVTLLAGGATAIAGPIGFVGLMVPHVARWIVGPDQRWIMLYTVVFAPILLLVSDVVGRIVMRPSELPVGVVTAFIGAPVLIVLIRRRKASGL